MKCTRLSEAAKQQVQALVLHRQSTEEQEVSPVGRPNVSPQALIVNGIGYGHDPGTLYENGDVFGL